MNRNRANLVPCFCQLCNGKLVTRYFRRKHAQAFCDLDSDSKWPKIASFNSDESQNINVTAMEGSASDEDITVLIILIMLWTIIL